MLPWECEDCEYKEVESSFYTFEGCPNCGSENFFHGEMIEEGEGL